MSHEIMPASRPRCVTISDGRGLPELVEPAGVAARFAWDEFFYAEHHNPHTQKAYQSAVRRFLSWCKGEGVELIGITPGMVGRYLVGLGGSASKRNLHRSALRGLFDRLVDLIRRTARTGTRRPARAGQPLSRFDMIGLLETGTTLRANLPNPRLLSLR
jgi:hypothetical protein